LKTVYKISGPFEMVKVNGALGPKVFDVPSRDIETAMRWMGRIGEGLIRNVQRW
jgi:hypothetical protein